MFPDYDEYLNYANLFNYNDQSQDLSLLNLPSPLLEPIAYKFGSSSSSRATNRVESPEESDFDEFISQMLVEEDMEDKPCMFHDPLDFQAAEKPFYDTSPNEICSSSSTEFFDPTNSNTLFIQTSIDCSSSSTNSSNENNKPFPIQTPPIESNSRLSLGSSSALDGTTSNGSLISSLGFPMGMNIFSGKDSMMLFQKGVEEASKFLPKNITLSNESNVLRRKIHYGEYENFENSRNFNQSAISTEEAELSDMFDRILLNSPIVHESNSSIFSDFEKTQRSNMVDLTNLLIQCAQSTASGDLRTADELLKTIREHSSDVGDGSQRLAYYFANALEARLNGTGPRIYTAQGSRKTTRAVDWLKAYQFFIQTCPFQKIEMEFANHMILTTAEKASKLHIIDFGILYGFQWPILIKRLSERPGGPPKLRITGIDFPQPGFRHAERVEATGCRLARYCELFKVPFEFHAIAQKWETIKVEDIKIGSDEIVAVNCLHRFKNLLDESIVVDSPRKVDSPRDSVLKLIRNIKPDIFLLCVVNGCYNAPFFVTRFRQVLFHYSPIFDMFDTSASREDPERLVFEKECFGREIMNVVACEGTERVERPEMYKQWQVRINRAGFRQLPLNQEFIKKLRRKVKGGYHKDFVVDVDGHWTLQGWKGRISLAISGWVPA